MKRIWHPYWVWEDYKGGMWRKLHRSEEPSALREAAEFTGDPELYGHWMMEVLKEYPRACEHNLTDSSLNKQAWIGHAACALARQFPEYIVRKAWGKLSEAQREAANKKADAAVAAWNKMFKSGGKNVQCDFDF